MILGGYFKGEEHNVRKYYVFMHDMYV